MPVAEVFLISINLRKIPLFLIGQLLNADCESKVLNFNLKRPDRNFKTTVKYVSTDLVIVNSTSHSDSFRSASLAKTMFFSWGEIYAKSTICKTFSELCGPCFNSQNIFFLQRNFLPPSYIPYSLCQTYVLLFFNSHFLLVVS